MKKLSASSRRQYAQAVAAFEQEEVLLQEEVFIKNSSMQWQQTAQGKRLILTSYGQQNDLGPHSDKTVSLLHDFKQSKQTHPGRSKQALKELAKQEQRNYKLRLGRVDPWFVRLLDELSQEPSVESFRVIGPQALHAFACAAAASLYDEPPGVLGQPRHVVLSSRLSRHDTEQVMHRVLLKFDPHVRMLGSRKVQASTRGGYSIDTIQDEGVGPAKRNFRLGDGEDDCWAAFVGEVDPLIYSREFSAVVVASSGEMARMRTVHPATFVLLKRWMSQHPFRHPLHRPQDALQADVVEAILQLMPEHKLEAWLPRVRAEQVSRAKEEDVRRKRDSEAAKVRSQDDQHGRAALDAQFRRPAGKSRTQLTSGDKSRSLEPKPRGPKRRQSSPSY